MKPTKEQIERLMKAGWWDGTYHQVFDQILEERLMELDPEWMGEMNNMYDRTGLSRWYE